MMLEKISQLLQSLKNEKGATAIEYGLIAALVSILIVGALQALGPELTNTFNKITTAMKAANNPPTGP